MRKIIPPVLLLAALTAGLAGCRTTEANYRSAYDKAIAGRDSAEALENTIYGRERLRAGYEYARTASGDTVAIRRQLVKITEGGGGIRENLRRYCVVIGQFKQRFNAVSMRDRMALEGTLPGAFVVETGEPYYYVVGASYPTLEAAAKELENLRKEPPIPFRDPIPFILEASATKKR